MSIALSEFWTRLLQNGVADSAGCKDLAARYTKSTGSPPAEPSGLAEFLVKSGVLTAYQSAALLSPKPKTIRSGDFLIRNDRSVRPLSHWLPVRKIGSDPARNSASGGDTAIDGFLLRVPLDQLSDSRRQWLAAHAVIEVDTLQRFQISSDPQDNVVLFTPIPAGRSLLSITKKTPKAKRDQVVGFGLDLATALTALHERSLVHGAVRIDHVWLSKKGTAILLRDPSGPALSPHADTSAAWIDCIESPAAYAAPELASTDVAPNVQSDIYSLGCLLLTLLMGENPFAAESPSDEWTKQANHMPQPIIDAVEQGETGDPVLRVLAFALSKNPNARFASASQLADALAAARKLMLEKSASESKKTSPKSPGAKPTAAESAASNPKSKPRSKESLPPTGKRKKPAKPTVAPPVAAPSQSTAAPEPSKLDVPDNANDAPAAMVSQPPLEARQPESPVAESSPTTAPSSTSAPVAPADISSTQTPLEGDANAQPATTATTTRRKRTRRKKNVLPVLGGIMVIPFLILMLAIYLRGRPPKKVPSYIPPNASRVPRVASSRREVTPVAKPKDDDRVGEYQLINSDQLLFVPPITTKPSPPPLDLLPPGPAMIVSTRLGDAAFSAAAQSLSEALSPDLDRLIELAVSRSGVESTQISRLTVAFHAGSDGWPEASLAVELKDPIALQTLSASWKASASRTPSGATIFAGEEPDSDAFFLGESEKGKLPPDAMVRSFAVGSIKRISEVGEEEGAPILLPRALQTLWDSTNDQSHLTVLITPNFLFADGRKMLQTLAPEFFDPLKRLLIPDVAGLTLTAHGADDRLYVETRVIPSGGTNQAQLLVSVRDSIQSWGNWADRFVRDTVPDASWRLLANRLPFMLRFASQNTRVGISGQTVVSNAYLPADAAAQVTLATLLAMNTPPGAAVTSVASATPAKALSVNEMLERKMSISFTQESLQFAIDAVVDEFVNTLPPGSTMPRVRIIGGDLEKNGITQNQQIRDFEKNDMTLRQVLTEIVLGANPDKTATGPKDPKQSLIWVVYPPGKSPSESEILITTRDAAKEKNYELPPEFVLE